METLQVGRLYRVTRVFYLYNYYLHIGDLLLYLGVQNGTKVFWLCQDGIGYNPCSVGINEINLVECYRPFLEEV